MSHGDARAQLAELAKYDLGAAIAPLDTADYAAVLPKRDSVDMVVVIHINSFWFTHSTNSVYLVSKVRF